MSLSDDSLWNSRNTIILILINGRTDMSDPKDNVFDESVLLLTGKTSEKLRSKLLT